MNRIFILLLCAFAMTQMAYAKKQSVIRGKVINEEQDPIAGASVYLLATADRAVLKTAITDEKGFFALVDYPICNCIVEVTALGYSTAESAVLEGAGDDIDLPTIILEKSSETLEAVTVRRELPLIQHSNGKLVMNVENSSISAGNNAFDVLKRAPGVHVDKDENISLMGQQGVNVTIDGRPTYMTGDQLATLLKSTDGSQIKSIEVSTTRSAKDDAEGTPGVINITMKKNRLEGFNGTWIASAARGEKTRANSSIHLNYKKNNTTLFGNYGYTDDDRFSKFQIQRLIAYGNSQTTFDQHTDFINTNRTHAYRVGIEQTTSDRNVFTVQFSGNNNTEDHTNPSITWMGTDYDIVDSLMKTDSRGTESFDRYTFNANNQLSFANKGKFTTDLDYSFFKTSLNTAYDYHTYFPDMVYIYDPEYERSLSQADIRIWAAKADYTQPIWAGSIETGLKYSNVKTENTVLYENLLNDTWQNNIRRTNDFKYTEEIMAGYIDYTTQIQKFGIKVGLRGEYTISDGVSPTENKKVKRDYFDLFPSASLSYNLNENHVFALGYSRKVSRPNYRFLNPFEHYIDKRTSQRGNPYLNPQYTHGFTLNYSLMKMFNIALGHDVTRDAMVESIGQNGETKETWVTRENLGRQNTSYINLTIPARISTFWTMYNNLTGIYMHFKGPVAGYNINQGSAFFQGNSTSTFRILPALSAEVAVHYNSPFLYNVYKIKSRCNTDIGVTYNFKDQRSSLKLAMTDVFHSDHNDLTTDFEEFNSKIFQYYDSQTFRLTFNYKFGNLKQVFRRQENSSEEKERAL